MSNNEPSNKDGLEHCVAVSYFICFLLDTVTIVNYIILIVDNIFKAFHETSRTDFDRVDINQL